MKRRLRAKTTILRATAGLGVDDGTEVDFVTLVPFADPVGPGHQVIDVHRRGQTEQIHRVLPRNFTVRQYSFSELRNSFLVIHVNRCRSHG